MADQEINQPQSADSPVRLTPKDDPAELLKDGIALCLSGRGDKDVATASAYFGV